MILDILGWLLVLIAIGAALKLAYWVLYVAVIAAKILAAVAVGLIRR